MNSENPDSIKDKIMKLSASSFSFRPQSQVNVGSAPFASTEHQKIESSSSSFAVKPGSKLNPNSEPFVPLKK